LRYPRHVARAERSRARRRLSGQPRKQADVVLADPVAAERTERAVALPPGDRFFQAAFVLDKKADRVGDIRRRIRIAPAADLETVKQPVDPSFLRPQDWNACEHGF